MHRYIHQHPREKPTRDISTAILIDGTKNSGFLTLNQEAPTRSIYAVPSVQRFRAPLTYNVFVELSKVKKIETCG